ncbi:hypothetical protein [Methylocella sp.]
MSPMVTPSITSAPPVSFGLPMLTDEGETATTSTVTAGPPEPV